MLRCRKWRRERDNMLQTLKVKVTTVGEMQDQALLMTLFERAALVAMLRFIENTEVGKKPTDYLHKSDSWDIERLDQGEGGDVIGDEGG